MTGQMHLTDHTPAVMAALPADGSPIGIDQVNAALAIDPAETLRVVADLARAGVVGIGRPRGGLVVVGLSLRGVRVWRVVPVGTLAAARAFARTGARVPAPVCQASRCTFITREAPAVQCGSGQATLSLF